MQALSFRNPARRRTDATGSASHVCWIAPVPRTRASRKFGVLKAAIETQKVRHGAFPDRFSKAGERRVPRICQRTSNNGPVSIQMRSRSEGCFLGTDPEEIFRNRAEAGRLFRNWTKETRVAEDVHARSLGTKPDCRCQTDENTLDEQKV